MTMAMKLLLALTLTAGCAAHSNLIYPKPRNAIDSLLPEWSGGKAPYAWRGGPKPGPHATAGPPCACTTLGGAN